MKEDNGEKKKRLTKKQIIIIIAAICVLIAATAIAVPIGVIFGAPTEVVPEFLRFDQLSDMTVVAQWKNVRRAKEYTVEYCYGERTEKNVKKVQTTANRYAVARQTGVLSLRVKSDVSKGFSEWITMDITALSLKKPTVTINPDLSIEWSEIDYFYNGAATQVSSYSLAAIVNIDKVVTELGESGRREFNYLAHWLKAVIPPFDAEDWEDITVTVYVKATINAGITFMPDDKEKYLAAAYKDGEYGSAEIVITREIYERYVKHL